MQNYTSLEYLKIDIANHRGLDKISFEERIQWVDENEPYLEVITPDADDPIKYAGAVMALRKTQQGLPTGHLVGLDACASGIQIMSTITGCPEGAKNTGLTSDEREDIYELTTKKMNEILNLTTPYSKADVKKPIMTFFYGSKMKPIEAFGEDTIELSAFYEALSIVAPGAYSLMDILLKTWKPYATEHKWTMPDGFKVRNKVIQMVDTRIEIDELDHHTFTYRHQQNTGTEEGLANAANVVHSIDGFVNRELCRRCNYDASKLKKTLELIQHELKYRTQEPSCSKPLIEQLATDTEFISLVGIEHVTPGTVEEFGTVYLDDLSLLIADTLQHRNFDVITVHDEFKAHANNMNRVRQVYIEIFAELAESDTLNCILTELTGNPVNLPKRCLDLGDRIRNGNYALS